MTYLLLESAIRSLALGALVWLAMRLLRIKTSHVRSVAWTAVLLTSVTMPLLMAAMKALLTAAPAASQWIPAARTLVLRPLPPVAATAPASFNWMAVVIGAYGIVAGTMLLRILAGVLQGYRLRQNAVPLDGNVRVSTSLSIPVTFGSTILLPSNHTGWSSFKRDAVLLHEQCHVRHGHFYVHLLANIHRAVFWFSPLAWWLQKQLIDLAEELCDNAALREVEDRASYAEILIDLAKASSHASFAGVAMARGNTVARRVERILQDTSFLPEASMIRRTALIFVFAPLAALAVSTWLVEGGTPVVALSAVVARPQQRGAAPQPTPAPATAPRPAQSPTPERGALSPWPEQEVPDIISADERNAFQKLRTDEERDAFINAFWTRRDPSPGTATNEYRDEYYRRIEQANQKFTTKSGIPGWKTDRGRILILRGPADEIETHAAPTDGVAPFEQWRYRFLEGQSPNVILKFIDTANDGNYRLQQPDLVGEIKLIITPVDGK